MRYMQSYQDIKKFAPDSAELIRHTPGPAITISRQYGCHGTAIGQKLVAAINHKREVMRKHGEQWKFISKEILERAAQELNMTPEMLSDISFAQRNDMFSNMTSLFSNSFYASNTKIKNTIARFIYTFAASGNVVIIGRAAEAITKDIKRSIHVKLVAPFETRAAWVRDEENLPLEMARKKCAEEDEKRAMFRRYFESDRDDLEYFDATINMSKMTDDEAVEMIMILAEARGFI